MACELPDNVGRSLNYWTCFELARTLIRDNIITSISAQTVQRILQAEKLKPWRVHYWLSAKVPYDEQFRSIVLNICDLYTKKPDPTERILSLDELTSIQPRTRTSKTKPAQKGKPVLIEHEYKRKGAWNLFAAFDIQTGKVLEIVRRRKRQVEFISLLEDIEKDTNHTVKTIHIVCDNVSIHKGKKVQQWLGKHPRFKMHHTPVHCSWMNQVEQWFSILRRKRLSAPNFLDLEELAEKIHKFVSEWNNIAHPFSWTKQSFKKILDKIERRISTN